MKIARIIRLLVFLFLSFFVLRLAYTQKDESITWDTFFVKSKIQKETTKKNYKDQFYIVSKVIDGDTIQVLMNSDKIKVRLIGIDTPELVDPRKPVQCFGEQASDEAHQLLAGRSVKLVADASQDDQDKYGRLLRYVFRDDGLFINEYLIENGFAFEYTYKIPYKYQAIFKKAEKKAGDEDRGLWNNNVCTY